MRKTSLMAAVLLALSVSLAADQATAKRDIGLIRIDQDITLRRMVVHAPQPKGSVLLLHGFPGDYPMLEGHRPSPRPGL